MIITSIEETGATTAANNILQARDEMRIVRRGDIVPSKTNPRTHFDAAYLQELADNIKLHRVLQPLLVRPLPGARAQETFEDREPGQPLPSLEIVCGECRWRACGLADEGDVPVLIRHLDDAQVLQVQLVENLKRRDLHPLEEAEGFDRLVKDHGITVDEIADKIGKSASYIYKSLKLLELTPECREQMFSGKLNRSVALLVARAPTHLQAQIAEDVMEPDFHGEPLSFRAAAKLVQERYMLQLSSAIFDIKDATLLPKAGACASCPKRTGANVDLFADVEKADTCTDPKCFDNKREAHYAKVAKDAKARGQTVIQGKEAKEIMPAGTYSLKGYTLLDESQYIEGRSTTVRRAIGKENMPAETVIIVNPHTNKPMEALPIEVANKLLKAAAKVKKSEAAAKDKAKEPSERELQEQYGGGWRTKAVREIYARITTGQGQAFGVGVAREIAQYLAQDLCHEDAELVSELLGLGKVAKRNAIETHIKECTPEQVAPALLLMALSKDLDVPHNGRDRTPFIDVLAADTGVDVKAIQAGVKQEMKAAAAARKAEAEEKTAPKPAAKKPAAKKKATAAEAKAGIAQALQQESASANDFEVGQAVRFKQDLKGPTGHLRKVCGRAGTVETKHGDRGWMVRYGKNKHDVAGVDYTEIEHADAAGEDQLATGAIELSNGVKLDPQPAWPFPKDPNTSGQNQTLESELAKAEASGNKYRQRGLRKRIAEQEAASGEPAPNAAAAAWPFPTVAKKARKGAAA
jgi:ParB/RepB/Spo0J family partition protein